jgi:hypothetical protein
VGDEAHIALFEVFTPEEGATEHIGLDYLPHVSTFIADWVADTFAALAR